MTWVSIDEGLPEEGSDVLIMTTGGVVVQEEYRKLYEAPVSFSSKTICVGVGFSEHDFEDITHWMYIPELPR